MIFLQLNILTNSHTCDSMPIFHDTNWLSHSEKTFVSRRNAALFQGSRVQKATRYTKNNTTLRMPVASSSQGTWENVHVFVITGGYCKVGYVKRKGMPAFNGICRRIHREYSLYNDSLGTHLPISCVCAQVQSVVESEDAPMERLLLFE